MLRGGCIGQAGAREEVRWNEMPLVTLEREDHMTASRPHKVISEKRATFATVVLKQSFRRDFWCRWRAQNRNFGKIAIKTEI